MALGNGNPKEGDKGSNFFWELKVLQGLEAIAVAIEAGGGGGGGGITALTGDVTAGPGTGSQVATIGALKVTTAKIANNNVTFAKMQQIPDYTFLGNPTNPAVGNADVQTLSLSNIPYFTSAITGTPSAITFLRGNGSWANIGSAEGASTNATTGNIELGRTALAGTSDLSVARYVNAGTNTINISGVKVATTAHPFTADTSPAVIRGVNTAANLVTQRSIGVLGSSSGEYAYGVYGSATGGSAIGVYGINTAGGSGIGVWGEGPYGVWGKSTSGAGITGQTSSVTFASVEANHSIAGGYAIAALKNAATASQISSMFRMDVGTSSIGSAGQGGAMDFRCYTGTSNNIRTQVRLGSWWTDATTASYTGNFTIYVANAGAAPTANITFSGGGNINVSKTLPTAATGLVTGDLYTQTSTELGGSGAQKVICIV